MSSSSSECDDSIHEPTEQTSLLSANSETLGVYPTSGVNLSRVVLLIGLTVVVLGCGDVLIADPQTRLFESIICRQYYDTHDPSLIGGDGWVSEQLCKIEPVESRVALLRGWQEFFDSIPSLLLGIPYGWLADHYGRKPIITTAIASYWVRTALIAIICYFWQTLPLKLVWATSAHAIFGGGLPVASALAFVMISDIMPEAQRASAFLGLGAVVMFTGFFSPPISAILMKYNLWIPILLGLSVELISIPLAIAIPETLNRSSNNGTPGVELPAPSDAANETRQTRRPLLRKVLGLAKGSVDFMFQDWRIPPLVLTSFLPSGTELITLYVSKRYKWTIANATFLNSVRSGINLLVFLVIIPAISTVLMHRFFFTSMSKDLWLGRISCMLLFIGYGIFGFAPNIAVAILGMVIFTLGNGQGPLIRSLVTSLVEQHHVARLYTVLGIVNTLGLMIRGPLLAGMFQEGLQLGGFWIGLPFYLVSGLFACVTFLMFVIGVGEPYWKGRNALDMNGGGVQAHGQEDNQQDEGN